MTDEESPASGPGVGDAAATSPKTPERRIINASPSSPPPPPPPPPPKSFLTSSETIFIRSAADEAHVIPPAAVFVLEDSDPPQTRGVHTDWRISIWTARILALLLIAVGAAQWIVASDLRSKHVIIEEWYFAESYYGTAGQPWIGKITVMLGVLVAISAFNQTTLGKAVPFMWILPVFVLIVNGAMTFNERAVYERLNEFFVCTEDPDGLPIRNHCLCFDDPIEYEDTSTPSDKWTWGSITVRVISDVACEDLLDLSDDVLASFRLILAIHAVTFMALVIGCVGLARKCNGGGCC